MLFDTHAHINFKAFKADYKDVIARAQEAGIGLILPSSNLETSKRAVAIAEEYSKGVYAAVGLHPIHVFDEEVDLQQYRKLAQHPKVVAIGEVGLDYFHKEAGGSHEERQQKQFEVLQGFIQLAQELRLPLILHCRDAHDDLIALLSEQGNRNARPSISVTPPLRGVIHCFGSTETHAQEYIRLGFLLSFTGIITYKSFDTSILHTIPLEKIMVETDSPYLAPEPLRGTRNEPVNVQLVAQKIAEVKNIEYTEVERVTTENTRHLFHKINPSSI